MVIAPASLYGLTVTVCDASGKVPSNPSAAADTVVVPPDSASNATPPDTTLLGEVFTLTGISTVTGEVLAAEDVVSAPAAGAPLVSVTVNGPSAALTF